MKKLPIGEPNFAKIIKNNWLYVDKTQYLYDLIEGAGLYFLSRPRRFGKSLTIFTLQEILSGNKELFKGLWIYDNYDFPEYNVIRISFSSLDYKDKGLDKALIDEMYKLANEFDIELIETTYSALFRELIEKAGKEKQVVILIDEYDKPIVDYIDKLDVADKNKDILKNFYSTLKDLTIYIKMLFITGVSKFSGVSIFSDLNNLTDLTTNEHFSSMLGYTHEELLSYFSENIEILKKKYPQDDIIKKIKKWYNGYSWDGVNSVYNPYSILLLFFHKEFNNYWFRTGTPTFLIKLISKNNYTTYDIENKSVNKDIFDKHGIHNIEINSLLFQTGYLTIKEKDKNEFSMRIKLNYPNLEVENSFSHHLLSEFTNRQAELNSASIYDLIDALEDDDIEEFMSCVKDVFSNLTYPNIDKKEKYFHSIFYMLMKLIGYNIESEMLTNKGRIDSVLQTKDNIYIIEFKVGTAEKALKQIKDKAYAEKYLKSKKKITLLGIGFDKEEKGISDWKVEELL